MTTKRDQKAAGEKSAEPDKTGDERNRDPDHQKPAGAAQPLRAADVVGFVDIVPDPEQEMTEQARDRDGENDAGRDRERDMGRRVRAARH